MRDAANNPNGAVSGMMGVNMMSGSSSTISNLYETDAKNKENSFGFCPYCGAPLPEGAAFCPKCGKQLNQ